MKTGATSPIILKHLQHLSTEPLERRWNASSSQGKMDAGLASLQFPPPTTVRRSSTTEGNGPPPPNPTSTQPPDSIIFTARMSRRS